jgi:peptidoglycan/xylan/chitin deacetylase (PgdA/CDA1 family)
VIAKPYNEVKSDINESKNILNAHSFAYPFGQFNKQTLDILKELGFKSAFTTIDGYAHIGENPLLINRFEITPKITFDKFKNIVN